MALSERFLNCCLVFLGHGSSEIDWANWNAIATEWAESITLVDYVDFSWIKKSAELMKNQGARNLSDFGTNTRLFVFKDGSGMVVGLHNNARHFATFTGDDVASPTLLAILVASSPKLLETFADGLNGFMGCIKEKTLLH